MAKYLLQASYSVEGTKGLLKDGGSKRRAAAAKAIESVGGSLESFYFAFGDSDVYLIAEFPGNVSAATASLAINATGAVRIRTIVLLTPEEMDQAAKGRVSYRPPGR